MYEDNEKEGYSSNVRYRSKIDSQKQLQKPHLTRKVPTDSTYSQRNVGSGAGTVLKNSLETLKLRQSSIRGFYSNSVNLTESQEEYGSPSLHAQKFWKYHVLQIGQFEFYLTTNPDNRHRFVRGAPGYYVELVLKSPMDNEYVPASDKGFQLVFKRQRYPISNSKSSETEFDPSQVFTVMKQSQSKGGDYEIMGHSYEFVDDEGRRSYTPKQQKIAAKFVNKSNSLSQNGMVMETCYRLKNVRVCSLKEKKSTILFKNKIDGVKLSKEGSIYYIDDKLGGSYWHDSIIGLFRPCERDIKAKITKKVFSKGDSFHSAREELNESLEPMSFDDEDYVSDRTFYFARDGLLQRHPQDDSPNDYKLGWITIYDKSDYFSTSNGNWEMVLGLTFAAAFELMVDRFVRDSALA
ncbi:hypothetical protein KL914_002695 [Ogataea haglerorum]|uniref:Uncharacterized protein n=1 Tax=Ogataea haglerorum TaxID=1937702 RepID=A0ABQ7RIH6_9ASCO|nr:hypothetical protein KL914_002695 [Ogataea haglerorum]KAG7766113.1 hypothetical protein KL946_002293 [Ogataea haglerorum]